MKIIFVVLLICSVSAFPGTRNRRAESQVYDVVDIEVSSPTSRSKRSSSSEIFPQHLEAKFTAKGQERKIRLRRSPTTEIPVIALGSSERANVSMSKRSAVYHDIATGTPLMVKRSADNGYYLDGSLNLDSSHYTVARNEQGKHELRELRSINYGEDGKIYHGKNNDNNQPEEKRGIHYGNDYRNYKGNNGTESRKKRALESYVVELAIIFDRSIVDSLIREFGSDDIANEVLVFGEMIVHGINNRYATLSSHQDISMTVESNAIYFAFTDAQTPFIQNNKLDDAGDNLDTEGSLDDFTDWAIRLRNVLIPHDHLMWITDRELGSYDDMGADSGMAWMNGVCENDKTSIVSDNLAGDTIQIAAHELAHNLGAPHDDEFRRCRNSGFLMAPGTDYDLSERKRSNPFKFSSCSARKIARHARRNVASCLLRDDDYVSRPIEDYRAGQLFSLDLQCRQALDDQDSHACEEDIVPGDDVCTNLSCYNSSSSKCEMGIIAYEYSSCDDGKWCFEGRCVQSDSAPADFASTYDGISSV